LRRLVADLSALHADDAAIVLSELEPSQRQRVQALMRELSDFGFAMEQSAKDDIRTSIDVTVFSPWFLERLEQDHGQITPRARARLRDCAGRLYPAPQGKSSRSSGNRAARSGSRR
jgi:hypothetical protein